MNFRINLSLLVCCLLASAPESSAEIKTGDTFPSPAANGVAGKLPATKGKVVLYDFWASWCGPCRAALPSYEALYKKYHPRGLEIIAIGTDTDAAAAGKFVGKLSLSFPVVTDTKQAFVSMVAPGTMPTSYLVGKDGRVLSVHKGFHGNKSVEELSAAIEAALK
jgi:thiol-disulfide isomerase/thioredoxin